MGRHGIILMLLIQVYRRWALYIHLCGMFMYAYMWRSANAFVEHRCDVSFVGTSLSKQKKLTTMSTCPYKWKIEFNLQDDLYFRLANFDGVFYPLQRLSSDLTANDMRYESARLRSFENCNHILIEASFIKLAKQGFYYSSTGSSGCIKCYFCDKVYETDSESIPQHCDGRSNPKNVAKEDETAPNFTLMNSLIQRQLHPRHSNSDERSRPRFPRYNDGDQRHRSFRHSGVSTAEVHRLVEAGFFYAGVKDRVRCYSCGIELGICTEGMDPWDLHARESRNCCHISAARQPKENTSRQTRMPENPSCPQYETLENRLNTLASWPSQSSVDREELANAGFFYTGLADCVKCYFCGGGLRNWDAGDNPWIEHARWFSECRFVLHKKGQDFVNLCKMAPEFAALDPSDSEPSYTKDLLSKMNLSPPQIPNEPSTLKPQRELNDLISTSRSAAAKIIIDMGFSPKAIDDAIEMLKMLRDSTSFSVETIVEFMCTKGYGTGIEEESRGELNNDTHVTNESEVVKEENERLRQSMVCKICMDKDANIMFLPCEHIVVCGECAHALRTCPTCRSSIQTTVRMFML